MDSKSAGNEKPNRDLSQILFPLLLSCVAFLLWQKMDETSTDVKTILSLVSQNTTEISVLKTKVEVLENRVGFLENVVYSNQAVTQQHIIQGTSNQKDGSNNGFPPLSLPYDQAVLLSKDKKEKTTNSR